MTKKTSVDISIIIPVYNAEKYIEECVESVLNQSGVSVEVMAVDDGSTDLSGKILDNYATQYENVKVIHQKNSGIGAARNRGLESASGEYIGYLDSDDFFAPNVLAKLIKKCRENKAEVLFATYMNFFEDEVAATKWHKKQTEMAVRKGIYTTKPVTGVDLMRQFKEQKEYNVNVFSQIASKEFIKKNRIVFPEGIIFEDAPYTLEVLLSAKRALVSNEVIAHRRVRDNSVEHRPPTVERCIGAFKGIEPMMQSIMKNIDGTIEEEYRKVIEQELLRRYLFASKAYRQLSSDEQLRFLNDCNPVDKIFFEAFVKPHADEYAQRLTLKKQLKNKENEVNSLKIEISMLKQEAANAEEENKRKNQQIEKIRNSKSFQVGKMIVGPLSMLKKRVKRK